jgi:hypothetical protein
MNFETDRLFPMMDEAERRQLNDEIEKRGFREAVLALVNSPEWRRKHPDESQRAMCAARLATLPRGAPKRNVVRTTFSQGEAADVFRVCRDSVIRARAVIEGCALKLLAAVDRGEVSLNAAHAILSVVKMKKDSQEEALAALPDDQIAKWVGDRIAALEDGERQSEQWQRFDLTEPNIVCPNCKYGWRINSRHADGAAP